MHWKNVQNVSEMFPGYVWINVILHVKPFPCHEHPPKMNLKMSWALKKLKETLLYLFYTMCSTQPYPPHGWSLEIPRARKGVSKTKLFEGKNEAKNF